MSACARSFGVSVNSLYSDIAHNAKDQVVDPLTKSTMAKEQLVWLIKKGDLILSSEPKIVKTTFNRNFTEQDTRTGRFQIFAFDGGDLPDRLANAQNGSPFLFLFSVVLPANPAKSYLLSVKSNMTSILFLYNNFPPVDLLPIACRTMLRNSPLH
jgi:hypothetical protein